MKKWKYLALALLAVTLISHGEYGCAVTLLATALCMLMEEQ